MRPPGGHRVWELAAQERLHDQGFPAGKWYADLHQVDLHQQQVLVVGQCFHLLPMRHFRVEELFDSSFATVPDTDAYSDLQGWVLALARVMLALRLLFSHLLSPAASSRRGCIGRPCTNTRAEIRALIAAFRMLRLLLHRVEVLTNSQFCIQLRQGVYQTSTSIGDVSELMVSWAR